ncbi:hypothetical protein [Streptomyces spectabilis]|uniref:Uncharacterized protein n=1 Tax=Streptomyces spectabilis TaxID=68270 RepID=A0A516R101_STRST|nr:hypothetical protein [Streptomyces spectabilis]QDQ09331.1 hypothetical protein FH965_01095 [Streptomyces spectabilis]
MTDQERACLGPAVWELSVAYLADRHRRLDRGRAGLEDPVLRGTPVQAVGVREGRSQLSVVCSVRE